MSLQFSVTARNGLLNSIQTSVGNNAIVEIFTGAAPANCATAATGTSLVTWNLANTWVGAAASGSASFTNTPLVSNAAATGTAGYFRVYDSLANNCHMQGTVTQTGSGGDMTLDNTSINTGQNVQITSWTLTAPGA